MLKSNNLQIEQIKIKSDIPPRSRCHRHTSLLSDKSHVIKTVTNYVKSTLVGGECLSMDIERGIMKDKVGKHNRRFRPKGKLFRSVWGFVFVFFKHCLSVYSAQILTKP